MDRSDLTTKLDELGKKIAAVKEHYDFETRYHDGHKQSLAEIERHHKELSQKIETDLRNYEEQHGHINGLERQFILWLDSID